MSPPYERLVAAVSYGRDTKSSVIEIACDKEIYVMTLLRCRSKGSGDSEIRWHI